MRGEISLSEGEYVLTMRDKLGRIFANADFADLYPRVEHCHGI